MNIQFSAAQRCNAKARILLAGPSGAGKSYSALLLARGLVGETGKIAGLDTEHGSLSNYTHLTGFDVVSLDAPFGPDRYIEVIHAAEAAGYDCLIIDSLTHEWTGVGGILDLADRMEDRNSYTKWKRLTPLHNTLIDAMLQSKLHIIATVRSKMEHVLEKDDKGRMVPVKAGMGPQQRDGLEYEFTICFDIRQADHIALCSKDRTGIFGGSVAGTVITEATGQCIRQWLESGAPAQPAQPQVTAAQPPAQAVEAAPDSARHDLIGFIRDASAQAGMDAAGFAAWLKSRFGKPIKELGTDELQAVLDALMAAGTPATPEPEEAGEFDPFTSPEEDQRRAQTLDGLLTSAVPSSTLECRKLLNSLFDAAGIPAAKRVQWFQANGFPAELVGRQEAGTLVASIEQLRREMTPDGAREGVAA